MTSALFCSQGGSRRESYLYFEMSFQEEIAYPPRSIAVCVWSRVVVRRCFLYPKVVRNIWDVFPEPRMRTPDELSLAITRQEALWILKAFLELSGLSKAHRRPLFQIGTHPRNLFAMLPRLSGSGMRCNIALRVYPPYDQVSPSSS